MDWSLPLFLLCSVAGLIMVTGSLFLLWKGRIYLDKEGNSVSEVELPLGIKFKTQFPVLLMFLLGAFLLAFPINQCHYLCPDIAFHAKKPLEMVELKGKVAAGEDYEIQVLAVVDAQKTDANKGVALRVPYIQNRRYQVKYIDGSGESVYDEDFELREGEKSYELRGFKLQANGLARDTRQGYGAARAVERETLSSNQTAEFK